MVRIQCECVSIMCSMLLKLEQSQLLCSLVSAQKNLEGMDLDDGELDAMFVQTVDQSGFGKSASWSINPSPVNTIAQLNELLLWNGLWATML